MLRLRRLALIAPIWVMPAAALAQTAAPTTFAGLANLIVQVLTALTALAIGIGVFYYLWGIVNALKDVGSAKGRELLKKQVPWGLFAVFLIFFIWAVIRVLQNTLFGSGNNFNSLST